MKPADPWGACVSTALQGEDGVAVTKFTEPFLSRAINDNKRTRNTQLPPLDWPRMMADLGESRKLLCLDFKHKY